jgi:hypothetical protein
MQGDLLLKPGFTKLDACLKDFDEGLESMMGGRGYAICCCRDAAVSETHKENMDKAHGLQPKKS